VKKISIRGIAGISGSHRAEISSGKWNSVLGVIRQTSRCGPARGGCFRGIRIPAESGYFSILAL